MPKSILIGCATRDCPEGAQRAVNSLHATSSEADICLYVDDDQSDRYGAVKDCLVRVGPRVGPAQGLNAIVADNPDYLAYGWIDDNSVLTAPGWDRYVLDQIDRSPNRIAVVKAYHNCGSYLNFACVSDKWIETVGWLAQPAVWHFCWDTMLEMLGDATHMVQASKDQFAFEHWPEQSGTFGRIDRFKTDTEQFLWWCVGERTDLVRKLRAAMNGDPA